MEEDIDGGDGTEWSTDGSSGPVAEVTSTVAGRSTNPFLWLSLLLKERTSSTLGKQLF